MFENLFDLKVYFVDEDCPYNKQEVIDVDYFLSHNYMTRIIPSINYQDNKYLVGDIFMNKDTKSLYIFSFLTCHNISSIKKLGFYYLKNTDVLIDSSSYNISHFVDFKNTIDGFDFFKLDGINTEGLIKVGNLLLDDVSDIICQYEYFHEYGDMCTIVTQSVTSTLVTQSVIENLRNNIRKVNDFVVFFKENDNKEFNYGGYNSTYISNLSVRFITRDDFKFLPQLYVQDKQSRFGFEVVHNQIRILADDYKNDKKLGKRYITYFDLKLCESKLLVEDLEDVDYKYLSQSVYKYKGLNEDDDKKTYTENILAFF